MVITVVAMEISSTDILTSSLTSFLQIVLDNPIAKCNSKSVHLLNRLKSLRDASTASTYHVPVHHAILVLEAVTAAACVVRLRSSV